MTPNSLCNPNATLFFHYMASHDCHIVYDIQDITCTKVCMIYNIMQVILSSPIGLNYKDLGFFLPSSLGLLFPNLEHPCSHSFISFS